MRHRAHPCFGLQKAHVGNLGLGRLSKHAEAIITMGSCLTKLDEGPRPQHHGQSTPSPPAPQPVAAEPAPSQQAASPEQVSPVVDSQPSVNVDGPNGHSEGPTTPSPIQLEEPSEQESISAPAVAPSNSGQAPQGPQSEGRQQATTDGSDAMNNINSSPMGAESESSSKTLTNNWDKAKMFFSLTKPEDLLNDLHDLKYIGAGGYGKVFKVGWAGGPKGACKCCPRLGRAWLARPQLCRGANAPIQCNGCLKCRRCGAPRLWQ